MNISVNNVGFAREAISIRELGFGEKLQGFPSIEYRLDYSLEEVLELLRSSYEAWLLDQKKDDELTESPNPEYFRSLGYPSLSEFVKHRTFFCDAIKRFFYYDLLALTFPVGSQERVKWIINSVDTVRVVAEQLVITGTAYAKVEPTKGP